MHALAEDRRLAVLLVEDDDVDREAIRRIVRAMPEVDLIEAMDLESASHALSSVELDCALVDLNLPDGRGLDILDRTQGLEVPIIVLTGEDDGSAETALQAGAQDYLVKGDFDGAHLIRAIRYAIERKRATDLRLRLEAADRLGAIGQLAAGVAHEVNNPASWILTNQRFLYELLEEHLGLVNRVEELQGDDLLLALSRQRAILEESRAMLEENVQGMHRIASVVRQLKSFSRRTTEVEVERVDLNRLIAEACSFTRFETRHRAVVEQKLQALPAIPVDRDGLVHTLVNLLVNACHAIDEAGPGQHTLRVSSFATATDVVVRVEDSGIGVPAELQERIFQPFFTTKPRSRGSGLGLALTREIIDRHGGVIGVRRSDLGGACFELRLPIRNPLGAEETPAPAPERPQVVRRLRLLVVDDEPLLLTAVRRMLRHHHDVTTVNNGVEGVEALRAGEFDAVLCDVMMPIMDGEGFYRAVETEFPEMAKRVVFCTGGAVTPRLRAFLTEEGGRPTINKPFELADVNRWVNKWS